ncbi:MAG TPA: rhodanese-like domain-containing protein [Longimicrobiaceae bacterium]|nr:rhodanese-like domain-containing protein [Longimicrobiaceae bacterium]
MLLKRIYDESLAQASYLIGCAASGEAIVVDPNRGIEAYISAASAEGVKVTHVAETHIHADFVSGARELAARTGAELLLSAEGGDDWQYGYAAEAGATLLHHGDVFAVGSVRIEVLHTPGHTPEHLSFLITDTAVGDEPIGILTGDFVFVGDVGRPDLLERAAKLEGTMESAARTLFRSLDSFRDLPDFVQVWPGHGQGSACGKAMSAVPHSTVGYEKRFNWAVRETDEDAFVSAVLAGQPEPPAYFAEMKRINRDGPPILGETVRPPHIEDDQLANLLTARELVIDTRPAAAFAAGHVPGTINIPLNKSFSTWAGWLIPYDRSFYLIVGDGDGRVDEAAAALTRIGLDRVTGYFTESVISGWADGQRTLETVPQMTVTELEERLRTGDVAVLDVRGRAEWEAGHLPGVENVPVGLIADNLDDIPRDRPVVLQCQGGGRSAIAASLLRSRGWTDVANLTGGYSKWVAAGLPVEHPD